MYKKQQNDLSDNIDNLTINEDNYYNTFSNSLSNDENNNISKSPEIQLFSNNDTKIKNSLILAKELKPRETFQDAFKELEKTINFFENELDDKIKNSNFNFKYFLNEKMHILSINNPTNNFLKTDKIINHTHKQCMGNKNEQNIKENILIDDISDRVSTNSNSNKNIDLKIISQININKINDEMETEQKKENKLLGNKRKLEAKNNKNKIIWNDIEFVYAYIKFLKQKEFIDKRIPDNGNDKIYEKYKEGLREKNETIIIDGENLAIIYFKNDEINKIFMCQKALMLEDESTIENALFNIRKKILERCNLLEVTYKKMNKNKI